MGASGRLLLEAELIDEFQWWIHPQLVGPADPDDLLSRSGTTAAFDLVDTRVLSNGIILATYHL